MNKTYAIIGSHKTANNSSIIHSISHTKQKQRTRKYNHELLLEEQIMFKVFLEGVRRGRCQESVAQIVTSDVNTDFRCQAHSHFPDCTFYATDLRGIVQGRLKNSLFLLRQVNTSAVRITFCNCFGLYTTVFQVARLGRVRTRPPHRPAVN